MSKTDNYQFDSQERNRGDELEDSPMRGQYDGDMISAKELEANAQPPGAGVAIVGGGGVVGGSIGSKEVRTKGLRAWFAKQKVKWCIAILVALVLLSVVLVATLLAFGDSYDTYHSTPRLMKLWPRPNQAENFITFRHGPLDTGDGNLWDSLTEQLDDLVAGYDKRTVTSENRNVTECYGAQPREGYSCFFDTQAISRECRSDYHYGYELGTPCVFLQFNNISDWEPQEFNTQDLEKLDDLPVDLRATYKPNVVFLDCQGVTLIDKEHIGPIKYSPERGFKTNFFPYTGSADYMPPLVAVHFQNPKHGVAISVECKLYAKNIDYKEHSVPSGRIYFTLIID